MQTVATMSDGIIWRNMIWFGRVIFDISYYYLILFAALSPAKGLPMSQIDELVATLKRQLKAKGKTYADVAKVLDLSEASVKRLFSEQNFTLQRLDSLCQMLNLDLVQLIQQMEKEQRKISSLTLEQEEEIASDLGLILVAICCLNSYTFEQILEQFKIEETALIRMLAKLDRLKFIELLPKNRIKLLVSRNFTWNPDGPIQRFFLEKVQQDFFHSRFNRETEQLVVVNGLLSLPKNKLIQEKMQKLAQEFNELVHDDAHLPMSRKFGTTLVVAIRQWKYSVFNKFAHE
jgi:transcriptional regulator with XRE-family HTH domain